jgi:hypothetical protein
VVGYGPGTVRLLDRIRRSARHDQASVEQMLRDRGASSEQAREIVASLARRLSPDEMHDWLAHPNGSHPVPDPDSANTFGVALDWTPINAIVRGKAQLVVEEARRYAEGG